LKLNLAPREQENLVSISSHSASAECNMANIFQVSYISAHGRGQKI